MLVRKTSAGRQFLVIHRSRHDDWCLPKGKLEAGETLEEAAAREVREETGYEVDLGDFLGEIQYKVKGALKVVRYWMMHPRQRRRQIVDPDEVLEVVWLSGPDALARLEYPLDRKMLALAIARNPER